MQQGHDMKMFGRFAFLRIYNHKVVTVESDALLPPSVAPSEGCSDNCKEFLPLDRHTFCHQVVFARALLLKCMRWCNLLC